MKCHYSMTVTVITRRYPLPLISRHLSKIHFRSRPWPIYTNKCTKRVRQFTANSRQCLPESQKTKPGIKENIYTLPNLLTVSRIFSCPILGWSILGGNYHLSTGLLVYAGLTDWVGLFVFRSLFGTGSLFLFFLIKLDGFLARRYSMSSVLGTILDPAADKALMTTLTVTLTMQELIPRELRDFGQRCLADLNAEFPSSSSHNHSRTRLFVESFSFLH